jgi:hypothetical protein
LNNYKNIDKMTKGNNSNIEVNVKSTNLISLIGEAAKNKTKKIRVEFYPPYNEKEHSNLDPIMKCCSKARLNYGKHHKSTTSWRSLRQAIVPRRCTLCEAAFFS